MSSPPTLPPVVALEGPLGAGKTTLIGSLKATLEKAGMTVLHVPEDVETWRNWFGEDMLKRAIEKKDNLFAFQSLVQYTYMKHFREALVRHYDVIISERSPQSSVEVFSKLAYEKNLINFSEYMLLRANMGMFPSNAMVIGLWCEKFDILYDRVVRRDGNFANAEWTKEVYGAYRTFFEETLLWRNLPYEILDCTESREAIAARAYELIVQTIDKKIIPTLTPKWNDMCPLPSLTVPLGMDS